MKLKVLQVTKKERIGYSIICYYIVIITFDDLDVSFAAKILLL
jgi:hypothetical protein